ncbi:MAG: pseudouridine synthase [Myxococcota bacterium]
MAVSKPSGILTHQGFGDTVRPMLQRVRDALGRRVDPAHRLDRATSGVLVFGLNPRSTRALVEQFRAGQVEKRYVALLRGIPPEFGLLDHPVREAKYGPPRSAKTSFCRCFHDGRYALVEAAPRTGRRHQLRLHFKHMSCPIIGDVNYGDGRHNRRFRSRHGLHRLALHAYELRLQHPRTGRDLVLRAPLPLDLHRSLRSWSPDALSWLPNGLRPRLLSGLARSHPGC